MRNTVRVAGKISGLMVAGVLSFVMLLGQQAVAYNKLVRYPPRAVVKDGTVKTYDGQLIRGTSLHLLKAWANGASKYGLDTNNLKKLRDQGYLNTIRCNCLDPRWYAGGGGIRANPSGAYANPQEEALALTDSVVENCGRVGMYVMLNYHMYGQIYDGVSSWDIRKFWEFYAPRYKDKTWVMYEMENEVFQDCPTDMSASAWPTANEVGIYKIARNAAPATIIATTMEPVGVQQNWSNYLINGFGKAAGIDWTKGLDVWPWHCYNGTTETAVLGTKNGGIPMICTEWAYFEDSRNSYAGNAQIGGTHMTSEWGEKNGVSWIDWKMWDVTDQAFQLPWLIADANAKNYAWWNSPPAGIIFKPVAQAKPADFLSHASAMIQPNGRIVGGQKLTGKEKFRLSILPEQRRL
jgi:hypothetical protein